MSCTPELWMALLEGLLWKNYTDIFGGPSDHIKTLKNSILVQICLIFPYFSSVVTSNLMLFFWKNHSRYLPQVQQYGWWNFCSKQDSQNIQTWSSQGWERSVFLDQTNSFTLFNLNFKGIKIFMTTFLKVLKDCMKAICCSLPLQFPLLFSNYSHEQKWYGCEQ